MPPNSSRSNPKRKKNIRTQQRMHSKTQRSWEKKKYNKWAPWLSLKDRLPIEGESKLLQSLAWRSSTSFTKKIIIIIDKHTIGTERDGKHPINNNNKTWRFLFFYCFSVWEMSIEPQEHQPVSDRSLFLLFLLFPARGTGLLLLLKFLLLLPDAITSLLWCVYSLLLQFIPPKFQTNRNATGKKKILRIQTTESLVINLPLYKEKKCKEKIGKIATITMHYT